MNIIRTTAIAVSAVACAGTLSIAGTAQAAAAPPSGALASARAALHNWDCAPIADEKFRCQNDATGAGFSVNVRSKADLPKWQNEPDLTPQIAVVRKTYFLTVQPNDLLSQADFDQVKRTIARHRH